MRKVRGQIHMTTKEFLERKGAGRLDLLDDAEESRPRRGRMNKLEARFAREVLDPLVKAGEILPYLFESVKVRLAKGAWYTPDFYAQSTETHKHSPSARRPILYEVKGHWREASRVRIKVAAEAFHKQFRFVAVRYDQGQWIYEEF